MKTILVRNEAASDVANIFYAIGVYLFNKAVVQSFAINFLSRKYGDGY